MKKIIIISVICLVAIGVSGYFIFGNLIRKDFRRMPDFPDKDFNSSSRGGNLPITEEVKNEITSFFGNSPSTPEIEEYCNKNPMYCFYYCGEINPNHEICKEIMNKTQSPPIGELP